ncbi:MAG: hypothetical protein OXU36_05090 [Candidatus Poribacteria bacterium]|nr:hypothetical protein [Candidatus Poribacteria bacterium]
MFQNLQKRLTETSRCYANEGYSDAAEEAQRRRETETELERLRAQLTHRPNSDIQE